MDQTLLNHVVPMVLVIFRVLGLFMFGPILANRLLPRRFRVILALTWAVALFPMVPPAGPLPTDLASIVPMVVGEMLIGATIGLLASLPILLLDLAGFIIGHQMGFGLARVYNPEMNADTDILGQALMLVGLAVFVSLDGLEIMFLATAHTFHLLPPGRALMAPLAIDPFVAALTAGFDMALRISLPVTLVLTLTLIVLGVLMKTMPQINVLSVGFILKVIFGLAVMALSMSVIHEAAKEEIRAALADVSRWAAALTSAEPLSVSPESSP